MKNRPVSSFDELIDLACLIRRSVLTAIHAVGTGHAGSSLSAVEILTALYFKILRHDPYQPGWFGRDRFILSKGHGAPAYYAVLAHAGYFSPEELMTLRQLGSRLHGHPKADALPGVDVSTGSLGQGLSLGLGMALGFRALGIDNRTFVLLGDGEMQEGQVWEAMMAASSFQVGHLIAIVDRNGLQNDKSTEEIVQIEDLAAKANAFGWRTYRVDGHDFGELCAALAASASCGSKAPPSFIVADTRKGKGVSFMEGVVKWHHHPISDEELDAALNELCLSSARSVGQPT